MLRSLFLLLSLILFEISFAQPPKKIIPKGKIPSQSQLNKMMEDAMKDMSEEEKADMREMMKGVKLNATKNTGSVAIPFTDNKKLIPAKDVNRINSIPKKAFTDADINSNTALLYSKLMAKIPASEKAIITKMLSQEKNGSSLISAATIALMQGHYQAAMAFAMKAVQADPKNAIAQNNLAAILSQSGYPENAVPYLRKLALQFGGNSTILNNLGYAWLRLGDIDSARRYFGYAAMGNPNHPETELCLGLINELKGDPIKAADDYVKSFEDVPNPFTESMVKNVNAGNRIEGMDYEKMKGRITIYEYFKKDWVKIPVLSDDVAGYENNSAIQRGNEKMFEDLQDTLTLMADASSEEVDKLADKGETEFAKTMMKESMKGFNMMSMPAVYVQKILTTHVYRWSQQYTRELDALREDISNKRKEITKAEQNDKCPDFDRKNNEFMAYANPRIRKFYAQKIEEFRTWLNAYCTWSWYIAGNPKNVVLTQCVTWTTSLVEMYRSASHEQESIAQGCVKKSGDGINSVIPPVIPNFTCPAMVKVPVGLDELSLGAEKSFNNEWDIKKDDGTAMPNVTLSFGLGKNNIAEPGKYGNPYIKTGNGSVNASGINYADTDDDELMPLSKIMDELTALPKIPLDELTPLDPRLLNPNKKVSTGDIQQIQKAELSRRILNKMMTTKCQDELPVKKPRKVEFEVTVGEFTIEDVWAEEKTAWIEAMGHHPEIIVGVGPMTFEEVWEHQADNNHGGFTVTVGDFVIEDVKESGPQPVISNGLQVVETVKNFIKGLFN